MPVQPACTLTGTSRATYYRKAKPVVGPRHGPWLPRRPPPQALSLAERTQVLAVLNVPGYADLAIPQVWARELDQGRYWCSMSTMYRIARAAGQSRERRRQATHPPRVRPERVATGPSQVWSWDITALKGPVKGIWFKCCVVLDIFSPLRHRLARRRSRGRGRSPRFPRRRRRPQTAAPPTRSAGKPGSTNQQHRHKPSQFDLTNTARPEPRRGVRRLRTPPTRPGPASGDAQPQRPSGSAMSSSTRGPRRSGRAALTVFGFALLFDRNLFPGAIVYGLVASVLVPVWNATLGLCMWLRSDPEPAH